LIIIENTLLNWKYKMILDYSERGSEWRIWDLYIHTPCSFHEEFKIPPEEKHI